MQGHQEAKDLGPISLDGAGGSQRDLAFVDVPANLLLEVVAAGRLHGCASGTRDHARESQNDTMAAVGAAGENGLP
jgi:hypothetical protein